MFNRGNESKKLKTSIGRGNGYGSTDAGDDDVYEEEEGVRLTLLHKDISNKRERSISTGSVFKKPSTSNRIDDSVNLKASASVDEFQDLVKNLSLIHI